MLHFVFESREASGPAGLCPLLLTPQSRRPSCFHRAAPGLRRRLPSVVCVRAAVARWHMMQGEGNDWEWPEEKPSGSGYYNSAFGGVPPEPKKLSAKPLVEEEDLSKQVTMVRNYSWSDDTNVVKVYVPVPGVVRDAVTVDIGEDRVDLSAQTPMFGLFTMGANASCVARTCSSTHPTRILTGLRPSALCAALRRLFDQVDVSKSSYKVLEKKEKVIISLAKIPPPQYGLDAYVNFKPWYRLHHGGTDNVRTRLRLSTRLAHTYRSVASVDLGATRSSQHRTCAFAALVCCSLRRSQFAAILRTHA